MINASKNHQHNVNKIKDSKSDTETKTNEH